MVRNIALAAVVACAPMLAPLVALGAQPGMPAPKFDAPQNGAPASSALPAKDAPQDRHPLGVGDQAPTIAGVQWVMGDAVTSLDAGTIYVVDFWATWCAPCIELFPELSELQKTYKGDKVKVVSISIWEQGKPLNGHASYAEKVRAAAEAHKDDITFSVGYEGDDAPMAGAWMRAAYKVSLPCTFVVGRDGKIAWAGHPGMGLKDVVKQMVAGTFDAQAFDQQTREREHRRLQGMQMATQLQRAAQAQDWARAIEYCDKILALDAQMFAPTAVTKFQLLLTGAKDAPKAYAYAKELTRGVYATHAGVLSGLAGVTLLIPDAAERDLTFAHACITDAARASGGRIEVPPPANDAASLAQAVDRFEKVLTLTPSPLRGQLEDHLARFRAGSSLAPSAPNTAAPPQGAAAR